MTDPKIGISFRERMSGPFALGATDPRAGAEAGEAARTTFTMRAAIHLEDLDRFLADPDHVGSLSAELDFPPLGTGLPSKSGVFNLFSPAGDGRTKYMVYELGFEAGGKDYYMAGKKLIREDSILKMEPETTTLYTVLHEGTSASGPIVGAGILQIGVVDLLKMIPTFTVTNATSLARKAVALEKFGRFFAGQLYESYVRHAAAGTT